MSNHCNNYSHCTCCQQIHSVTMPSGATGIEGPQGLAGPQGPQGEPGVPFSSNFASVQLLAADITYTNPGGYTPVYYNSTIVNGDLQTIQPPPVPGDEDVILSAGHTYFIMFNTHGSPLAETNQRLRYRVVVNGVIIPNSPTVAAWENDGGNACHIWTYTATTDTTLHYEIQPVNNSYQLRGAYLNIVTLN